MSFAAERRALGAAYVLLSAIGIIGLSIGSVPFAVDLANHATRLFIECNAADPVLSRMYTVHYDLIPNLAIDLINQPFCGVVDPMTVVRGAMAAAMAGVLLATWKIHVLLNQKPNAFVLLAPAMTFNIVTGMGYLNYLVGTFLFLAFVWTMLRYKVLDRHPVLAFLLPNLFGALLFLCHIFALGLAGVFLFGMRFARGERQDLVRRTVGAGALTALAFVVPLLMMLFAERSGVGFAYPLPGKIRALWAPMLYSSVRVAGLLTFVWFALFLWALREKHIRFAASLRWPLIFLGIFALLLPSALLDAVDLDSRSLVAVAFLAIAAIGARPGTRIPSSAQAAAIAVAVATIGLQLGTAVPKIVIYERQVAELRGASARVFRPYDTVLAMANQDAEPLGIQQFYTHLLSYETRERQIFNPSEFTGKGMQPLRVTPEFVCLDVPAGRPLSYRFAGVMLDPANGSVLSKPQFANLRYAYRWDRKFDYVLFYDFGKPENPFPTILQPVERGSFFTIYRVEGVSGPPHCQGGAQ